MRKYTVINNKTGKRYHYSKVSWNLSWFVVFMLGLVLGAALFSSCEIDYTGGVETMTRSYNDTIKDSTNHYKIPITILFTQ